MNQARRYLRYALAVLGFSLSVTSFFGWCRTPGCEAVQGGMVMGLSIPVWGMVYFPALFAVFTLERFVHPPLINSFRSRLVALGAGGDLALGLALISTQTFCLSCAEIAVIMAALCALEVQAAFIALRKLENGRLRAALSKAASAALLFVLGMLFVAFNLSLPFPSFGSTACAAEPVPTVGSGAACIRVYSDYFCPACRRQESEITALTRAVKTRGKSCRISFVDVPLHGQATQNYSVYFAACYLADQSAENILKARRVLFQLAEQGVQEKRVIEESLRKGGARFNLDYGSIFRYFNEANRLMREDNILSTPTVVVARPEGKRVFKGQVSKTEIMGVL